MDRRLDAARGSVVRRVRITVDQARRAGLDVKGHRDKRVREPPIKCYRCSDVYGSFVLRKRGLIHWDCLTAEDDPENRDA